jgi:heat shock protein HslJ
MFRYACILVLAGLTLTACNEVTQPSELFTAQGTWELQSLGNTPVTNPENFTITFGPNDDLGVKADCNVCGGAYETNGNNISIDVQFCTLAYCGDASLDGDYQQALANTTRYTRQGNQLTLDYSGGTLIYQASQ